MKAFSFSKYINWWSIRQEPILERTGRILYKNCHSWVPPLKACPSGPVCSVRSSDTNLVASGCICSCLLRIRSHFLIDNLVFQMPGHISDPVEVLWRWAWLLKRWELPVGTRDHFFWVWGSLAWETALELAVFRSLSPSGRCFILSYRFPGIQG